MTADLELQEIFARARAKMKTAMIRATFDNDHAAHRTDQWGCSVAVGTPLEVVVSYLWMDYLTRNGRIRQASDGAYSYPAEGWMHPEVTDAQSRRPVQWRGAPVVRDLTLHLRRAIPARASVAPDDAEEERAKTATPGPHSFQESR